MKTQADLLAALGGAVDRARDAARQADTDEVLVCFVGTCDKPAQPEHTPCCSSTFHGKAFCCEHYCRAHFVEAHPCSPDSHAAAKAAQVPTTKD
ncbi:hypothetical protein [Nocardioides sp. Arc9.136]|uniref:hypothetical protein n=1 Tax=Nocardioides sp. Arc9.136 TaxID=2996826 RepID=UPI002666CA82|nr:hypothetical protein [Nocardioides sp. Arc9.136]WKN47119.1 hypothetical protein OSR43_13835 [Nocardioides sp. Arc9.136]